MYSIERDMNMQLSETEGLIKFIDGVESGSVEVSVQVNTPVMKASVVLSLYNIIESTITKVLTQIHEKINSDKVNYNNLTKEIRDLVLVHLYKHKEKQANIHKSLEVLHKTVDLVRGKGYFELPYEEMIKNYQLYSGNLDARAVRKVMAKYGIVISENHGAKLISIKEGRNTLSHGNRSFEEFGRDVVIATLRSYFDDVKEFLKEVVLEVKNYIEKKGYRMRKPPTRKRRRKRA